MKVEKWQFLKWIRTTINPMRKRKRLKRIRLFEAMRCYSILQEFQKQWKNPKE